MFILLNEKFLIKIIRYFNGEAISLSEKYIQMSAGTEYQLKVRQCQKEDKGVYTVMAENLYGRDDRLISLRVERK